MNPFRLRKGFTIIELAVVLTVIGILATIAVYTYGRVVNKARSTQAKIALKHLQRMEHFYFAEHDRYTDNVVLLDFNPVECDYYRISVSLFDNDMRYIGYANGIDAMAGDLWTITPGGAPVRDNVAKTLF